MINRFTAKQDLRAVGIEPCIFRAGKAPWLHRINLFPQRTTIPRIIPFTCLLCPRTEYHEHYLDGSVATMQFPSSK